MHNDVAEYMQRLEAENAKLREAAKAVVETMRGSGGINLDAAEALVKLAALIQEKGDDMEAAWDAQQSRIAELEDDLRVANELLDYYRPKVLMVERAAELPSGARAASVLVDMAEWGNR